MHASPTTIGTLREEGNVLPLEYKEHLRAVLPNLLPMPYKALHELTLAQASPDFCSLNKLAPLRALHFAYFLCNIPPPPVFTWPASYIYHQISVQMPLPQRGLPSAPNLKQPQSHTPSHSVPSLPCPSHMAPPAIRGFPDYLLSPLTRMPAS